MSVFDKTLECPPSFAPPPPPVCFTLNTFSDFLYLFINSQTRRSSGVQNDCLSPRSPSPFLPFHLPLFLSFPGLRLSSPSPLPKWGGGSWSCSSSQCPAGMSRAVRTRNPPRGEIQQPGLPSGTRGGRAPRCHCTTCPHRQGEKHCWLLLVGEGAVYYLARALQ